MGRLVKGGWQEGGGYKISSKMFGEDIFGIADTRLRGKRIEDLKRNIPHGSYFLASRMPIHVPMWSGTIHPSEEHKEVNKYYI